MKLESGMPRLRVGGSARGSRRALLQRALSLVVIVTVGSGCAASGLSPVVVANDQPTQGRNHCLAVEKSARVVTVERSTQAWVLAGLTAGVVGGAATMTAIDGPVKGKEGDEDYYAYKSVNLGLLATGALLGAATAYVFDRASASSKAAAEASEAINLDDKAALEACNKIIGGWHSERTVALGAAASQMKVDDLTKRLNNTEKKIDKVEEDATKKIDKVKVDVAGAKEEAHDAKEKVDALKANPPGPAVKPK